MITTRKTKTDNQDLEAAARAYCDGGGRTAMEEAVRSGEALVAHYAGLYSRGRVDEDLRQAGFEGLLKALKRYDPSRKIRFSTYASHCIIGEIRHELRDRALFKVPEWLKTLQVKVLAATGELAQEQGTMPTLAQVARRVNVTEEGIVEAMQAGCASLEEIDLAKVRNIHYESFKLPIEDRIALQLAIEKLDQLQQKAIRLVYLDGFTQEQAARRLGLNQRKVSRLLNRGLQEMRASFT